MIVIFGSPCPMNAQSTFGKTLLMENRSGGGFVYSHLVQPVTSSSGSMTTFYSCHKSQLRDAPESLRLACEQRWSSVVLRRTSSAAQYSKVDVFFFFQKYHSGKKSVQSTMFRATGRKQKCKCSQIPLHAAYPVLS